MLGKNILFSAVIGRLTRAGAPLAGVTVRRSFDWAWGGERSEDSTVTDADGRFALAVVARASLTAKLAPHQPSIIQAIVFDVDGKAREGWHFHKTNYDNNGELKGRPIVLDCELDEPDVRHETHYGFCRLD